MSNEIKLGNGVIIHKRSKNGRLVSKYWYARISSKVGKKPDRRILKTTNRKEAEVKAKQLANEFWEKEAAGYPTTSRRFNQVAALLTKQMEAERATGGGKEQYEENIRILQGSMIPFFTTQLIGSIERPNWYVR